MGLPVPGFLLYIVTYGIFTCIFVYFLIFDTCIDRYIIFYLLYR